MMDSKTVDLPIMYHPNENSGSVIKKLIASIEEKYGIKFKTFWEFNEWSVNHIPEFWAEMWDFSGVVCSKKYEMVVDLNIPIEKNPEWFEGARLNFAENLLKYRDNKIAMILTGEQRDPQYITFAEMYEEAKIYAAAFRKFGLKKNDVVVCYMPNRKEPILAMQAVTSIGAIWTGALPKLGPKAVLNRFKQVKPKAMLTIDRFIHDGEEILMYDKVKYITDSLPSLEIVIVVPTSKDSDSRIMSDIKNSCFLNDFLSMGRNPDGSVPDMIFEQVSFSHPVFINYTSGTTGLPKPVVHGCGGLMSMARDFCVHTDATRSCRWLTVSSVGWVTWNMLNTLHFLGFTLVVFEGVPYFRSSTFFWSLIDEFKITHAFLPTSIIDELMKRGYLPSKKNFISDRSIRLW